MNQKLLTELQNLGFSDKEARVYVASLQIGSAPMQKIAASSNVNRATTYVIVESLMNRGLMSSFTQGKKRLFTAEDPNKLLEMVHREQFELQEREKAVKDIMPDLKEIFEVATQQGQKPRVKFYEGKDGLKSVRNEFLKVKSKEIMGIFNYDYIARVFDTEEDQKFGEKREKKNITTKAVYTSQQGPILADKNKKNLTNLRYLDYNKYNSPIDISVFDDKVALTSLEGNLMSAVIENENIADAMRQLIGVIWASADGDDEASEQNSK